MTAKVILNPYSNRWNSQKRWSEAESALKAAGVDFHLAVSEKKGQIVELAEQAVLQRFSPIIVAGGDGSIGDAANGLMQAAQSANIQTPPLGIMPTGSANDIAFALGLPTDLHEAARELPENESDGSRKANDRYFVNNSAAPEPYDHTRKSID
jgi:diacylglycerol kinase (ATP)